MRRILGLAAVSLFVFAVAAAAQLQYVVTGSDESFSVAKSGSPVTGASDVSMAAAINAIRMDAQSAAVSIRFGADSTDTVKLVNYDSDVIRFTAALSETAWDPDSGKSVTVTYPAWGKITISGNIASSRGSYGGDLAVSGSLGGITIESSVNIESTSYEVIGISGDNNDPAATTFTITGGDLSATREENGSVISSGGALLKITGGKIWKANATLNVWGYTNGPVVSASWVEMTGGAISQKDGVALNVAKLTISGGKIETTGRGTAINSNYGFDSVAISGTAEIVSASSGDTATIVINSYYDYGGNITISGGKVANSANGGRAVYIQNAATTFALTGKPEIIGAIATRSAGRISVDSSFAPGDNKYTLQPLAGARADSAVVVIGGAAKKDNFVFNNPPYEMVVKGADLVISTPTDITPSTYTITAAGDPYNVRFRVRKDASTTNFAMDSIQNALKAIQNDAKGLPCNIRLGDGVAVVNMRAFPITFDGSIGEGWGKISLSGKMTSTAAADRGYPWGAVTLRYGVSLESTAEIDNTNGYGFSIGDNSGVTVKDGTVSSSITAIYISSGSAAATIAGGTVSNNQSNGEYSYYGPAISNNGGTLIISGGAVKAAGPQNYAVNSSYNARTVISGTAEISSEDTTQIGRYIEDGDYTYYSDDYESGTVRNSNATIEITGGTISNTSKSGGAAIYHNAYDSTKKTVIYGGTITSQNAKSGHGTVHSNSGTIEILGGEISNTADNNDVAVVSKLKGGNADDSPGIIAFGGSPTINGLITTGSLTVLTSGENAFNPGDKIYNLINKTPLLGNGGGIEIVLTEGQTILTDGARFIPNFAIAADSGYNKGFKLAANGNDAVATTSDIYVIDFNLNGGVGTPPPSIYVAAGARLGEAAMPPTAGYRDAGSHLNDGIWYRSVGHSGGVHTLGTPFRFDAVNGTRVNDDMILVLNWTDEVSVLANDRVIPQTTGTETAAVAPVTVTAGELTVGPNPAARQSGAVNFFWSGKGLASGKLFVYDASGSLVKKINIAGKSAVNSGKRSVGSWDLTDAKGRPAAEGTYLVRGTIVTQSGSKVKASALVGVVK